MLRNYLLLAFKVLQRHKFYTFVSLFGISITLMVLVTVTSLIDSFVRPNGPERNSERFLIAGIMSVIQRDPLNGRTTAGYNGLLGYRFVENHVLGMQTPELIGVFSGAFTGALGAPQMAGFRNGTKITADVKRTDANYWKILQFEFLEGRPINEQEHLSGAYVAVISATMQERYFAGEPALGKSITLDGSAFEVIGVVEDVSPLQTFAVSDIWLPIFATSSTRFRSEDRGSFMVLLQARSDADLARIKEEYQIAVRNYQPDAVNNFVAERPLEVSSWVVSKVGLYIQLAFPGQVSPDEYDLGPVILAWLGMGMLLFMLLPVINLININISRILDRASEIGVRKSFGASSGHLCRQFIVENLVVTALGGLLGFLLAMLALWLLDSTGLLRGETFSFSYRVFGLGLLYILVFGLLSSAWPAWKMSRLDPVHALKGATS
jgi:putative ABC transport system permease protein